MYYYCYTRARKKCLVRYVHVSSKIESCAEINNASTICVSSRNYWYTIGTRSICAPIRGNKIEIAVPKRLNVVVIILCTAEVFYRLPRRPEIIKKIGGARSFAIYYYGKSYYFISGDRRRSVYLHGRTHI